MTDRTTEELLKDADDTINRDYCAFVEEIQSNASPIHKLIAELSAKLRKREQFLIAVDDVMKGYIDYPKWRDGTYKASAAILAEEIREAMRIEANNE